MAQGSLDRIEYRDEPAVFLVAATERGLDRARRTAELASCRVASAVLVGQATEALDRQAAAHPIFFDVSGGGETPAVTAMLDRIGAEARTRGRRCVLAATHPLIDLVAARAWDGNIVHLIDADEPERVAALSVAARPRPARLHDVGRESNALLQQLSEEVGRIANILASLSTDDSAEADLGRVTDEEGGDETALDAGYVRALIRARRMREQFFRDDLFADPAWDMLLDLMAARLEGRRVAVSSLCIAAAVPATTALRWIKSLTDRGLFVRRADPEDGRRVYIELSDETARTMAAFLRAARRLAPSVI